MIFETGEWFTRNGQIAHVSYIGEYNPKKTLNSQEFIRGTIDGVVREWYANGNFFIEGQSEFDLMYPVKKSKEKTGFNFQPEDEKDTHADIHNELTESEDLWRRSMAEEAMIALSPSPHEWARDPIVLADLCFRIADAMIMRSRKLSHG
jgi:hypothetical protein